VLGGSGLGCGVCLLYRRRHVDPFGRLLLSGGRLRLGVSRGGLGSHFRYVRSVVRAMWWMDPGVCRARSDAESHDASFAFAHLLTLLLRPLQYPPLRPP
jgi:hypothetical protein